jgi:hypothetical protein
VVGILYCEREKITGLNMACKKSVQIIFRRANTYQSMRISDATPDQKCFCITDINKLCDIGIWITRNGADKNE